MLLKIGEVNPMKRDRRNALAAALMWLFICFFTAGGAAAESTQGYGDVFLKLYREPYQGAFHILIPKGWKAEGGMIPSGVQWNVVDLVENNIRFRVTSPDGKSFFGWYPRFYFQDPQVIMRSSGGILQPQMGPPPPPPPPPGAQRMLALSLPRCIPVCAVCGLRATVPERISKSQDYRKYGPCARVEALGSPDGRPLRLRVREF